MAAAGCSATLIETRRRVKGPVEAVGLVEPGAGEARYAVSGPGARSRRRDALARIASYCEGETRYKIVDEAERELSEGSFPGDDIEDRLKEGARHYRPTRYQVLYFECLR